LYQLRYTCRPGHQGPGVQTGAVAQRPRRVRAASSKINAAIRRAEIAHAKVIYRTSARIKLKHLYPSI
jgi:hypothetical protein